MKKIATIIILFSLIYIPYGLYSQTKCKVLVKNISETYEGKCKKGLANGKGVATGIDKYEGRFSKGYPNGSGTYTWANGSEYTGDWEFGQRSGEGTYRFIYNDNDSIIDGIWKNDKYIGPIPPPPIVMLSRNVQNYTFSKQGDKSTMTIQIYMNGSINSTIQDLVIVSSNGSYQNLGNVISFSEIMYPATFKITYKTWNKLHTAMLDVTFEFKIVGTGDWLLKITN
ncbi:MAG: hypothetical protein HQ521_02960 [Bacteroidetes bacterium]|nr:hypothetical protein [Bacteroidota bacterium]